MSSVRKLSRPLLLAALVLAVGCGKTGNVVTADQSQTQELNDLYEAYSEYVKNHQKPPQQLSDLRKYEAIHSLGLRVLKEGKYVAVWGVSSKDSGTVLVYEKDAPTKGGPVLMADGSIKNMS